MPARASSIHGIEMDLVLEALARRHGYDFRHYARASLKRRMTGLAQKLGCAHIAELVPRVLHDDALLPEILAGLSVPVTEMFRDPPVFKAIRDTLLPMLATHPRINIWQAGCATGEEVYSLAILLKEADLLHKTQIYATDINDIALAKAEDGIFPAKAIEKYSDNYLKAGGQGALASYFSMGYGFAKIDAAIKEHISFAHHNLVADGVFCEVGLVVCRNVLIYFDRVLQDRVLGLFSDSLSRGGFLCLGTKENVTFSAAAPLFAAVDPALRLYKKRG
ncbi:protein-glutamate O-methyltransferase CheR [Magnetospirillum sp. SS-4]|uniref:CheR family methyltransferase n=1 Tax=Magnetospirillum sp. SS-4 TaxID=2681465 RepID=UPI00138176C2|nr:protein-glutamate O-methyltransferase CheR [Magnetospirillum sp. SS-4]CAA7614413.1 putative methyltransferase Cher3 [Magnetospirillum sp. SS-4]